MRNITPMKWFITAIAHIRSPVQTGAALLHKRFAHLIALHAGSTVNVAKNDLFTDICTFASKSFGAEVMWVIKYPFGLNIIHPMKAYLF